MARQMKSRVGWGRMPDVLIVSAKSWQPPPTVFSLLAITTLSREILISPAAPHISCRLSTAELDPLLEMGQHLLFISWEPPKWEFGWSSVSLLEGAQGVTAGLSEAWAYITAYR